MAERQRGGVTVTWANDDQTVQRNRAQQIEWYGEPLGTRFRRLLERLEVSQAALAGTLGLSAPMLSQLMSGQRAKISNPAVLARLLRLEELAAAPDFARWPPELRQQELARIRAATPTTSGALRPPGAAPTSDTGAPDDPVAAIRRLLRVVASPEDLEDAASLLEPTHPGLATFVRAFGTGSSGESRAHYARLLAAAARARTARPR